MQPLFTPCDIFDVTRPQKENSDSVWVSLVALGSCQLHFDNVYLLVDYWTFASTNNKYLEDSRANRRDCSGVLLQLCSRPSILLISSTIWCRFWPFSAPVLSESNQKKEQKRKLLDCCIPVRLRTSAVHWACEVRDQAPTRHRQWLCHEKAIAVLAGRRSEILEGLLQAVSNLLVLLKTPLPPLSS